MNRIKCFMVERTGRFKIDPSEKACSCGDANCGSNKEPIWKNLETGEEFISRGFNMPVGAMWFAPWYSDNYKGLDGQCLVVMTPGGMWIIDSVASNCTRKDDKVHKCWVREGEPPNVTVGKGGNTCNAGAGSILINGYHGFLRGGFLEDC